MRLAILLTALVAAGYTIASLAAYAAGDPRALALQQADFPSGARASSERMTAFALSPLGVRGLKGVSYEATIPAGGSVSTSFGSTEKAWFVNGVVFAAPDDAGARRLFALGKGAGSGLDSSVTGNPVRMQLPAHGAEQLAFWTRRTVGKGINASVFVRKGTVVWQLTAAGTPTQWRASRAQVVAELRKYATKQKRRVGSG